VNLFDQIPKSWQPVLKPEFSQAYIAKLEAFLEAERATQPVFPPESEVFRALELTPFENVRVLIVGQDPYHDDGQAHGLAFSVKPGMNVPPSLRNIYKELETDLGILRTTNGFLEPWARQGVLLLNTSLTVRAHVAGSHKNQGWEKLTDAIIRAVSGKPDRVVFVLWGAPAGKKLALIDSSKHTVVQSAHPSPLSAHNGFFGSRPFSKINAALLEVGQAQIDWRLES
jgi:uracil-DNA glycosylase